ncbi:MAG: DUF2085 domain-containing protein [archaeon]
MMEFLSAFGALVCHQLPERSLFFAGQQVFVCARDVGIYLGVLAGFALFYALKERGSELNLRHLVLLMLPVAVDGLTQLAGWESTNGLRLFTGGLFGVAMSCMMVFLYDRMFETGTCETPSDRAVLGAAGIGGLMVGVAYLPQNVYSFWLVSIGTFISIVLVITGLAFFIGLVLYRKIRWNR